MKISIILRLYYHSYFFPKERSTHSGNLSLERVNLKIKKYYKSDVTYRNY